MENGNGTKPAPKITGFSTPIGSSTKKKQESPEQRSEKINQQNAAAEQAKTQKQEIARQQQARRAVTEEEIVSFRKNRTRKRIIIAAIVILAITVLGVTAYLVITKYKELKYTANSSIYNDALPIAINDDNTAFLIDQNGKKISDDYNYVAPFEAQTTIASKQVNNSTNYYILDKTGKEFYSSTQIISQSSDGKNYILNEDGKFFLTDQNGKKLSDKALIDNNSTNYRYALVADDNRYSIIDSEGNEKISNIIDGYEVSSFSYANNPYENQSYCAVLYRANRNNKLTVYNCETGKVVKEVENTGYYADFDEENKPMLRTDGKYYYFYANDVLFESNYPSTEIFGGIIQTTTEEGATQYFDPKDKALRDDFPSHSLVQQNKLDTSTEINANCTTFEKNDNLKLQRICENIYLDNSLLKLNYDDYYFELLPENLSNYLNSLNKNYLIRVEKNGGREAIYDYKAKSVVKGLEGITINQSASDQTSYVQIAKEDGSYDYYNLITDRIINIKDSTNIICGTNYLSVEKDNTVVYYNKDGKEIYKITKGE